MKVHALIVAACLPLAACAGGKAHVMAEKIDYPVSLSKAVFDRSGAVVVPPTTAGAGHFSFSFHQWTLLWTLMKLSDENRDISEQLKHEVESRHGNAVVNLTVKAMPDYFWYVTSLVPVVPTWCEITVEGDVVRIGE